MLFEGDGETGRSVNGLAVDGFDVDCDYLGSFRFLVAVKTGRLPFEIQVALQKPFILREVGNALVGTETRCEVAVPLLGKIKPVEGNVRRATGLVLGMTCEAQDLRNVSRCYVWYLDAWNGALPETRHPGPCDRGQDNHCREH